MGCPECSWLKSLPLFGGLVDGGLEAFSVAAETVHVAAGETVYREGESAEHLYLVEAGTLAVVKGEEARQLWVLKRGEFFGEMSFVDMQPRSATVRAESDVILWRWPYCQLHAVYRSDPKAYTLVVMNIAREISRRLRRADEVICSSQKRGP